MTPEADNAILVERLRPRRRATAFVRCTTVPTAPAIATTSRRSPPSERGALPKPPTAYQAVGAIDVGAGVDFVTGTPQSRSPASAHSLFPRPGALRRAAPDADGRFADEDIFRWTSPTTAPRDRAAIRLRHAAHAQHLRRCRDICRTRRSACPDEAHRRRASRRGCSRLGELGASIVTLLDPARAGARSSASARPTRCRPSLPAASDRHLHARRQPPHCAFHLYNVEEDVTGPAERLAVRAPAGLGEAGPARLIGSGEEEICPAVSIWSAGRHPERWLRLPAQMPPAVMMRCVRPSGPLLRRVPDCPVLS